MRKINKSNLNIYSNKEGVARRQELLDMITKSDTFLPESILHEDLDRSVLEFVKEELKVVAEGEVIPVNNIIFTAQRWIEFSQTWTHVDQDNNVKLPFITVIREPDPQPGTHPAMYTIPNRKTFTYITVKTWDGNQMGANIYKIPQPVAVDINYQVIVVCDKMRDLNRFNKKVLQSFSSRQAYTRSKGHYIPIILESISDESPIDDMEGRRYFQQVYTLMLQGFLIDEDEFEMVPAINRTLIVTDIMPSDKPVRDKIVLSSVEVEKLTAKADGTQTTFSTADKIGLLMGVLKNGLVLTRGVDYFYNEGTTNIIFPAAPAVGSDITIFYVTNRTIKLYNSNVKVNFTEQQYVANGSAQFELLDTQSYVVFVSVNGVVSDFTYDPSSKSFTMTQTPATGASVVAYVF